MVKEQSWLIVPQRRLGTGGLVALLIIANILIPFSIDIYTPSVPMMPAYFDTNEAMVNLTLMGFFLFFTIGLLLFGPVSDKFGRKPVLVLGIAAYIGGSALCACALSIYMLIVARVVQALGAGAVNAVTLALVKDCFVSQRRGALLAIIQVLAVVGPVIAPLMGGIILQFASWRAIFWVLAALGGLCLVASLLFTESLAPADRLTTGAIRSLGGLFRVARQKKLMLMAVAISFFNLPFMAYIAVGSYVYIDFFGQTQQVYTYFFAATAAISVLGPMLQLRFGKHISPYALTYILIFASLACGIGLFIAGDRSIWIFAILMSVFAAIEAGVRPYTTDMMLEMTDQDVGSVSSMINFLYCAFGVVGMMAIMAPFPDYVIGLGVILAASMAVAAPFWFAACKTRV